MISVVISTHNRTQDLICAVESISNQSQLPEEVVVVDDGSRDVVNESIFDSLPNSVKRKLVRNDVPRGAGMARNRGVNEALGDYVAFLDDDDRFMPTKIERLINVILDDDFPDLVFHTAIIKMVVEDVSYNTKPIIYKDLHNLERAILVSNCIGGTPMVTVKKAVFLEFEGFDAQLPALEDYELWVRMLARGIKCSFINSPLTKCYYVTKRKSMSKSLAADREASEIIKSKHKVLFEQLTKAEIEAHSVYSDRRLVQKLMLNRERLKAWRKQLSVTLKRPNVKNVGLLFSLMVGLKFTYWLRSKLS